MTGGMRPRRGLTLVEIMVAITIAAVIGLAFTRLLTSQLRFADKQVTAKDAREVSRAALNAISTDIRMVDADSGVIAAAPDSFTVLAPYAMGLVCGAGASGGSVIALMPYDSASYAEGGYAGYAYVDTTTTSNFSQVYQYVFSGTAPVARDSATTASSAPCVTANNVVGVFRNGSVTVQPGVPARSHYQAAMLFRQVTYAFRPSATISGSRGLYRRVVKGPRGDEELVAPFDTSAKFRYYLLNGTRATSATGSTRNLIRGIELQLNGLSDRRVQGSSGPATAPITTAIFFKNRPAQ